jgi:hypothetical protein
MRAELEAQVRAAMAKQFGEEVRRVREQEAKAAEERCTRDAAERVRASEEELRDLRKKVAAASSKEAELLKKQRELDSRERELALETERRVAEEVARAREHEAKLAEKRAELHEEQQRLRDEEHRQKIAGLEKTITELTRKVQQGSQQVQGEAQEVVLQDLLSDAFPTDGLEDVPTGHNGADLVQRVHSPEGRDCGSIVWESKRTRSWSNGWLPKVRDDQREAGAACAVIVTQALPPDIRHFGVKEGVWICAPSHAVALATVLRGWLVDVGHAKRAAEGSGRKMQLLYEYMTGTEFRNRVGGLLEAFTDMQADLDSEKRTTLTRWKRREKTMSRALGNVAALGGELQGIVGRELDDLLPPAFESLPALPQHEDAACSP